MTDDISLPSDKQRMLQALQRASKVPVGKELITQALHKGCRFVSKSGMPAHIPTSLSVVFNEAAPVYSINLNMSATDDDLTKGVAHELRHFWQSTQGLPMHMSSRLSVPLQLVWRRLIEADAHAFSDYFSLKLNGQHEIAETFDWKKAFRKGLTFDEEMDHRTIKAALNNAQALIKNGSNISEFFNQKTSHALSDIKKILVPGIDLATPTYYPVRDIQTLVRSVKKLIPPVIMAQAQLLQAEIKAYNP